MEADAGVKWPQAEECLQPPEAGRGRQDPPLETSEEVGPKWQLRLCMYVCMHVCLFILKERESGERGREKRENPKQALCCPTSWPWDHNLSQNRRVRCLTDWTSQTPLTAPVLLEMRWLLWTSHIPSLGLSFFTDKTLLKNRASAIIQGASNPKPR